MLAWLGGTPWALERQVWAWLLALEQAVSAGRPPGSAYCLEQALDRRVSAIVVASA
jgi:hypothetical protein